MNQRPLLLDAFSGAGGASWGYYKAGFDVVGVDINPQPHYPCYHNAEYAKHFKFFQADVFDFDLEGYDAYHASPPCQFACPMTLGRWKDRKHLNLIPFTRKILVATGKPYVIENVEGARNYLTNPIKLCGSMFRLGNKEGNQLRRHRYFECPSLNIVAPSCQHNTASAIGVYGGGQHPDRRKLIAIGVWGHAGGSSKRDRVVQFGTDARREAMGIDWMTGNELSQAIPPAYTEFIGKFLWEAVKRG